MYEILESKDVAVLQLSNEKYSNFGLYKNDVLIVDNSVEPQNGDMVVVAMNSVLSVKIFQKYDNIPMLISPDCFFVPMNVEGCEYKYIGTITNIVNEHI